MTTKQTHEMPRCATDTTCITCSDEGIPMRVASIEPKRSIAICHDETGGRSEVMTELVGGVSPGDVLLVHAGTALLALDRAPHEARTP